MILGIGTDLCNIDRISGVLARHGDRFRNRVFTPIELAKAARRKDEAGTLAKRWAAKEACSKALGTGLAMGISWKDMAVRNLPSGQPTGFQNIDFPGREARYDAARGLVLAMPVEGFNPDKGAGDQGELTVTINQSSGEVTAEVSAE